MAASRQDAWTEKEDRRLAMTVLEHIISGSTQLKAFEAVGIELKRTAAACGFRWNSTVRKQHEEEIEKAKLARKGRKKSRKKPADSQIITEDGAGDERELDWQEASRLLRRLESFIESACSIKAERDRLELENKRLTAEKDSLRNDYHSLLTLLDKARNLVEGQ